MTENKLASIEVLPPITNNRWLPEAGEVTVYRLRLMTAEEIAAHGLEDYLPERSDNDERSMGA